jgi:predicted 2-oxoglutarate/Fe(II)-dependent dioxygenase YbiX/peroxiredoxin
LFPFLPESPDPMSSPAPRTDLTYVNLQPGDPAPWFVQRVRGGQNNEGLALHKTAGSYVVLCFFATTSDAVGRDTMAAVEANRALFDDDHAAFYGVTIDRSDETAGRLPAGLNFFLDYDGSASRAHGAVPRDQKSSEGNIAARRFWLVLDPTLRVLRTVPFAADGSDRDEVFAFVRALPPPEHFIGVEMHAPVLMLPNVFERELCDRLISFYEADGGTDSGFMREVSGKTVLVNDPKHKRRKDYNIQDMDLINEVKTRIARRIVPEIAKAFQFNVTRMERFLVACYAAEDGGHFDSHRDNTTKGTAHRRFAVSLNLNDDYEGGELSFPEYGKRRFKPAPGAAVVFSCSLLHAASKVMRGRRYVFLPFLYDEAAAVIREENNKYLDPSFGEYKR